MPDARGMVEGNYDKHHVTFYGISTCIWCKRTRKLLEEREVAFEFTYVDLLQGAEREEVVTEVRQWNPSVSFPTIVVDESKSVVGYKPEEIKEALGL